MPETSKPKGDRRRCRPALACVSCRKSKIRCDRKIPCGACVRSRHKNCVFESLGSASRASGMVSAQADQADSSLGSITTQLPVTPATSTSTAHPADVPREGPLGQTLRQSTIPSSTEVADVTTLVSRIFELERRLEESTGSSEPVKASRPSAQGLNCPETIQSYLAYDFHAMNRSVMSKTRYFGQSHWMNGVHYFKPVLDLFEKQSRDTKTEAMSVLNRCKALARTVKEQRTPDLGFKYGAHLPSRQVADQLVDGYLRTTETVFRILHVPTFKADYEKFWSSPEKPDIPFLIQLQLVMAIGCAVYDEHYSLRKSAVQWVYEAQSWLDAPIPKAKLTIAGIQIMLLLCQARQTSSIGGDLVWISVGSLMRTAFYMGLHRDPSKLPRMTRLQSEMRRRLWNTILEFELLSSMDSGGPPMISLEGSDTGPPANIDDDQLMEEGSEVSPQPVDSFTDMSVALALRDTFRERLGVARLLNNLVSQNSYDDTLRMHHRLSSAHKSLSRTLRSYSPSGRQPTNFQSRMVDFVVRRHFLSLHIPYRGSTVREWATYAFSKNVTIDAATKLYVTGFPNALDPTALKSDADGSERLSTEGDDMARLMVCCGGSYRSILSQSAILIALELQIELQDDDAISHPMPRPDLLQILRHAVVYNFARVQAGETNVKGFLFATALSTHVSALMEGRRDDAIVEPILKAALRTEHQCFEILKKEAGQSPPAELMIGPGEVDWDAVMNDQSAANAFYDITSIENIIGTNGMDDFMGAPNLSFAPWG
ncbi:hypothetical protein F5Y15DRAFT_215852 [Xylariaceae sp. FL0016]|nr:hypothetical protein F5Y15DRAFT_215852 [Xylariaceae sp. FL0016]